MTFIDAYQYIDDITPDTKFELLINGNFYIGRLSARQILSDKTLCNLGPISISIEEHYINFIFENAGD